MRALFLAAALAAPSVLAPAVAAQPSPEVIRVAVVQGDPEVTLQIHGAFTILSLQTNQPIEQGREFRPTAVRATPQGLTLGATLLPISGLRVEPVRDATLSVNGQRLRGTLEILRQNNSTLLVINHVALEDYLKGVVSKEAPDYWPQEALKAVAIAARTYALYRRLTKAGDTFDVMGNVMSQDYGGHSAEKRATTRAVDATRGKILVLGGKLFPSFYHSTCGGMTEHGRVMGKFDLEPLRGGIGCEFCQASPFFSWQRRLTAADVNWALRSSAHGTVGSVRDVRITAATPMGRVEQITIVGASRTLALTGYDFRALFGFERIRSLRFTVIRAGGDFILDGHGWGHGVGMCQWGASELARRGVLAEDILTYYYPGVSIVPLAELAGGSLAVVEGGS